MSENVLYKLYIRKWFHWRLFGTYTDKLEMLDYAMVLTFGREKVMWKEIQED